MSAEIFLNYYQLIKISNLYLRYKSNKIYIATRPILSTGFNELGVEKTFIYDTFLFFLSVKLKSNFFIGSFV